MTCADRYLWTLPMFHANGWTFVWIVTAAGGTHVCVRKVDAPNVYRFLDAGERITMLCAAPTVLIMIASAPDDLRLNAPRGVRGAHRRRSAAAHTIERVEGGAGMDHPPGVRAHRDGTADQCVRARPEHSALSPGERRR